MKSLIEVNQLQEVLRRYQAAALREYNTDRRHVYYSKPLGQYIAVRMKGGKIELDFTESCPCSKDY